MILAGSSLSLAGVRTVVIPGVPEGPTMKGDLSDPLWNRGAALMDFTGIFADKTITQQTVVHLLYDSKYLYIGVDAREADMKSLVARFSGLTNDVWRDDSVEIFLDTLNAGNVHYHFCINSIGGHLQERLLSQCDPGPKWECRSIVKTGRDSGGWTIELAVPFADMGIKPSKGLVWAMNVGRSRKAVAEEYSAWNPSPEGFDQPYYFGKVIFGDANAKSSGVLLTSWGDIAMDPSASSVRAVSLRLPGNPGRSISYDAVMNRKVNGKVVGTTRKTAVVEAGRSADLSIPYPGDGPASGVYSVRVKANGVSVFDAETSVPAASETSRVWREKYPLFKELLSKTAPGEQKNGAIYWSHTYDPSLSGFGKEYGLRYCNEEALKEFADEKLLPLCTTPMLNDRFLLNMADKYHFKVLFYPEIMHWTAPDAPKVDAASFMVEPRAREAYFNDLKASLSKYRKYIYGVYSGDEVTEWSMYQMIRLYETHKSDYPFIREIDEQVKKEYGGGKYGIPETRYDENPYRWIAARRWMMNYLAGWQKEVYETVHAIAPEVKVISFDPVSGHKPVGFDRMSPYFDIATQQLYPPADTNRQQFGFTTKMVADLTGKSVWPCVHVEHYPYSTTLDEVRELMSEVQRNGGKGFHFWLKDEIGNNSASGFMKATKWGFPARWRELCEINTLNAKMTEVAVPMDPDSAIFYSEDHYQSFSEKVAEYPYPFPNEPEWAYTFFGPVARTWFKFVNDNMVEDRKVDLSKFKSVIVPVAKYERSSVANDLVRYATNGGTIVIGDAGSFMTDIDGTPLTSSHDKLIGGAFVPGKDRKTMTFSADCSLPSLRDRTLPVYGPVYSGKVPDGSEIIATFNDGSPAAYRKPVGKGSSIVFLSTPFTEGGIGDIAWKEFFKAFSKDLGLQTDRKIWRFEFPRFKTATVPEPSGTCLTGNYVKWWQDRPAYVHDAQIAGSYSYSVAPDAISDRGGTKISFADGKLLDRKRAYTTLKKDLKPEDFVVSWKTEKATSITFDLLTDRDVSRVALWYSGQFPGVKIEGSSDGKTWTQLGDAKKQPLVKLPAGYEDILDTSIELRVGVPSRYVRITFAARDAGQTLTLAECEIWGRK
jgi:hypothetical protein